MTEIAFGVRESYRDTFVPGTLNIGGEDYDLAGELQTGGGFIVVDTARGRGTLIATVLGDQPALKRVAAAAAREARERSGSLDELTKPQLLELPEAEQIEGAKSMKVDELRAAVRQAREEA